jgi:hypothetical protein
MLRITKNYFHPKDENENANAKDVETHFVLTTEQTKNLCKMAHLYAAIDELCGQLKEEEVVQNFGPVVTKTNKRSTIKRPKYTTVVSSTVITLAQKILSPLTRPVELEGISQELIDFVKSIGNEFKELSFPEWFTDTDRKKRVQLDIVFKDTLDSNKYWNYVPFTKLNTLLFSTENISEMINNIFQAVFSNYKSKMKTSCA